MTRLPYSVNTGCAPACVKGVASASVNTKQCSVHHCIMHSLHSSPGVSHLTTTPCAVCSYTVNVLGSVTSACDAPTCYERSHLRAITSNPRNSGRGQGESTQGQTRRLKQPKRHFFTFWPKGRNPRLGWFGRLRQLGREPYLKKSENKK